MNKFVTSIFASRKTAEDAINELHKELDINAENISYVYQNTAGEIKETSAADISAPTTGEGAKKGAITGGTIGAIAGLATAAGVIPVIGPIFAAGPLITALGIGAGAVGTTAAGAATGAAAGGLIGALAAWGMEEPKAKEYEDRVRAGDIVVTVHADETKDVEGILEKHGALNINTYAAA